MLLSEAEINYLNILGIQQQEGSALYIVRVLLNNESECIKYENAHPLPVSSTGMCRCWHTNPVTNKKEYIIVFDLPSDEEFIIPAEYDKYKKGLGE